MTRIGDGRLLAGLLGGEFFHGLGIEAGVLVEHLLHVGIGTRHALGIADRFGTQRTFFRIAGAAGQGEAGANQGQGEEGGFATQDGQRHGEDPVRIRGDYP